MLHCSMYKSIFIFIFNEKKNIFSPWQESQPRTGRANTKQQQNRENIKITCEWI